MATAYVEIPITKNKFTLIDVDDYFDVIKYKWYAMHRPHTYYAVRDTRTRKNPISTIMTLHKFLTSYTLTDHANGNGLDNRRINLRQANSKQNKWNQRNRRDSASQYKGVTAVGIGRYRARILINGTRIHLGYFNNELEAAKAYDLAATNAFGEFAALNFPDKNGRSAVRRGWSDHIQ